MVGGWQLAVGGWRLAIGGWRLLAAMARCVFWRVHPVQLTSQTTARPPTPGTLRAPMPSDLETP